MAKVEVNAEVLRWARETAGLTLEEAAHKLQIKESAGISPEEKLNALERGHELPTRPLLLKMSKQYRRPLLSFYLEVPPRKGDRGEDFRHLPDDYPKSEEGLVDALLRDIKARQSMVNAALKDEDEADKLPFVGAATMDNGVAYLCDSICKFIGFDLRIYRGQRNVTEAFAYLRSCAERAGIFVLIVGDLGSHHTKLSVEAFRGFALADPVAPFVVINDQDSRAAWSFTLLHEIAHIFLGQTGVSGAIVEAGLEQFCNDVASEVLLPLDDLATIDVNNATEFQNSVERINQFAENRKLSRSMVAYKLFRLGSIDRGHWQSLKIEFKRQWIEHRDELRRQAREQDGGPNYYLVRRHRLGNALIDLVSRMTLSGTLTSTKAGRVLGVKPRNVYELLQTVR